MKVKNEYELLRDSLKEHSLIVLRNKIFTVAQKACDELHIPYYYKLDGLVLCINHIVYESETIYIGIFDMNDDYFGISWCNFDFRINLINCSDFDEVKGILKKRIVDLFEIISMKKEKEEHKNKK